MKEQYNYLRYANAWWRTVCFGYINGWTSGANTFLCEQQLSEDELSPHLSSFREAVTRISELEERAIDELKEVRQVCLHGLFTKHAVFGSALPWLLLLRDWKSALNGCLWFWNYKGNYVTLKLILSIIIAPVMAHQVLVQNVGKIVPATQPFTKLVKCLLYFKIQTQFPNYPHFFTQKLNDCNYLLDIAEQPEYDLEAFVYQTQCFIHEGSKSFFGLKGTMRGIIF